jgi:hypothetical protein
MIPNIVMMLIIMFVLSYEFNVNKNVLPIQVRKVLQKLK